MFALDNLIHRYAEHTALQLEHWSGEQGSHHLVLGVSGSGKTTLLHHLGVWWQTTHFPRRRTALTYA